MEAPIGLKGAGGRPSTAAWHDCSEIVARPGGHDLNRRLAAVVAAIGHDRFSHRLADLLTAAADIDQINVLSLDGETTRPLFSWHRARPHMVEYLIGRYVAERRYRHDPTLERLKRLGRAGLYLGLVRRMQIEDDGYRRIFFDEAHLEGKLSILDRNEDHTLYHNYYFADGAGPLSPQEIENLAHLAETVSQCILRHVQLTASPTTPASQIHPDAVSRILARRAPTLTSRETEVCSRIVTGYTTEAIALDLSITANSVATYRKRAYAKLGICSQHQLFLLCLDT